MIQIETEPLFDLVAHCFAFLPISDHSTLYSDKYIDFVSPFLHAVLLRTLPADAGVLAGLYHASPGASSLQFFSCLFSDVDAFTSSMQEPSVGLSLPVELVELFRIALYGELAAGFLSYREAQLMPCFAEGAARFIAALAPLCARWPGLADVRWVLSAPLLESGRLWVTEQTNIAVGLPGFLETSSEWVLLRACHEYFLSEVQRFAPDDASFDAASFDDAHFYGAEITALSLAASLWEGTPFAPLFASFVAGVAPLDALRGGALIPSPWRESYHRSRALLG